MAAIDEEVRVTDGFSRVFQNYVSKLKDAIDSTDVLTNAIKQLGARYLNLDGLSKLVTMSDNYVQMVSRLNVVNESLGMQEDLQTEIYYAAQRASVPYTDLTDIIARIGTSTPDLWNNGQELVQFGENLTKMFSIAGVSQEDMNSVALQLIQTLDSGVLKGVEFSAIFRSAPNIIQRIADYLGVPTDQLRAMASEGQITAEMVKNALLSATDEINESFNSTPKTWSQIWTMITNAAQKEMEPVFQKINDIINSDLGQKAMGGLISGFTILANIASETIDLLVGGANYLAEHWDSVKVVLYMAAAAVAVLTGAMVAAGIASAAAWVSTAWPLLALIAVIGTAIAVARYFGASWEDIASFVGGLFGYLYAQIMNTFIIPVQNVIAMQVNFIYNLFQGKLSAISLLFADLAMFAINAVKNMAASIESLLNSIPGVKVNLTGGLDKLYNVIKSETDKIMEKEDLTRLIEPWEQKDFTKYMNFGITLLGKYGKILDGFDPEKSLEDLLNTDNQSSVEYDKMDLSGIENSAARTAQNTGALKKDVDMSKEDIKSLVDIATKKYVNHVNLTSQTPIITVNGANTGDTPADRRALASMIRDEILEQTAAAAEKSRIYAF